MVFEGGKEIPELGDEGGGDFFISVQPENPGLAGQFEVFLAGFGKALPRGGFDPGAEIAGDLSRVVGAPGVEDEPFPVGIDLAVAPGQVLCLVAT